ncbi:unnamed protein product [Parnassius mnemosyne]|uniref:DNA ligase n=1 Tax=Parnassius mnemosyne TaxID=213953 RepID=A0AAV1L9V6_9NEOP
MNLDKLFKASRVVICVLHRTPCRLFQKICPVYTLHTIDIKPHTRNMSQKSITSFFKITPKKTDGASEDNQKDDKSSANHSLNENPSPVANGKRSSKRLRSESIENVSPKASSRSQSPISSEKKKKVKRQRIDSSESESDVAKASPEESIPIKVDNDKPKTYDSPKSKRNKVKTQKSGSTDIKSPKGTKAKSQEKKLKIKTEKESPSPKKTDAKTKTELKEKVKDSKNIMSAFVKKENGAQKESSAKGEDIKQVENSEVNNQEELVAEIDYNPGKPKYHPVKDACWSKGQKVPYLALAKTLEIIEATSARLKMVEILSNYFRSVIALTPEDLLPSIYLCLNQLAPAYVGLELGIAETYLMKAVGQCTGRSVAQVRAAAQRCGELALAAQQARTTQRTMFAAPPLAVRAVHAALKEVAAMTGHASVNKKIGKIQSLYVACRHSESKFLIRSLEGKLRVGLAEQSLLQALALAVASTPPAGPRAGCLDVAKEMPADEFKSLVEEHAALIKTTYCECPNYELLLPVLLQHGVRALPQHCRLTPGIPLKPMLAHPTKGVHEIFTRFEGERFTCEWKYDGERAQIHVPGDQAPSYSDARIFSRNQENNTSKYPDVLSRLPALLKDSVRNCVLDCESVAYDTVNKKILPFQILSTRKRKDADEAQIKVQVCVFVFDLLLLNGRALVREPLAERRKLLREHFNECPGEWQFAESRDCSTMEEVQQFLEESIKGSCEGLMVKMLHGDNSKYDIARRSHNWLKLKKDYLEGVGDSIDAVVIGAYHGRGKRAGRYGGFLLACYDAEAEQYQSLCKLGTGFSDQDLETLATELDKHLIDGPRNYYSYDASHTADVWFAAARVWELRCADLSLSPAHRAAIGLVDPDKGISLRFPRFIRVREDKTPEEATSAQQIAHMYLSQDQVKNQATKPVNDDDFY